MEVVSIFYSHGERCIAAEEVNCMHNNQLLKIAQLVNKKGIQFVASILKDKLPEELNREEYHVVKLSQADKLFRIWY